MAGGYSPDGWFVYGQHPAWTVMTLCGPGVEAVSMYAREATAHALVTYQDRMPAEVWYGRPDIGGQYCHTAVYFQKQLVPVHAGHRGRLLVRPSLRDVPHGRTRSARWSARAASRCRTAEILEVTAIIHAAAQVAEGKRPAGGVGGGDGPRKLILSPEPTLKKSMRNEEPRIKN